MHMFNFSQLQNMVPFFPVQVTRKIIRRFVLPDGTEKEEVVAQGAAHEPVTVEEGDSVSKVVKRTVLKSDSEHSQVSPEKYS